MFKMMILLIWLLLLVITPRTWIVCDNLHPAAGTRCVPVVPAATPPFVTACHVQEQKSACVLCRTKIPTSDEESLAQVMIWVEKEKPWAQVLLASMNMYGRCGLPKSYQRAKELYAWLERFGVKKLDKSLSEYAAFNISVLSKVPFPSAEGDRRSSEDRVDLGIIQWWYKADEKATIKKMIK